MDNARVAPVRATAGVVDVVEFAVLVVAVVAIMLVLLGDVLMKESSTEEVVARVLSVVTFTPADVQSWDEEVVREARR